MCLVGTFCTLNSKEQKAFEPMQTFSRSKTPSQFFCLSVCMFISLSLFFSHFLPLCRAVKKDLISPVDSLINLSPTLGNSYILIFSVSPHFLRGKVQHSAISDCYLRTGKVALESATVAKRLCCLSKYKKHFINFQYFTLTLS